MPTPPAPPAFEVRRAWVSVARLMLRDEIAGDVETSGAGEHLGKLRVGHGIGAALLHRGHDELTVLTVELGADGLTFAADGRARNMDAGG